MVGRSMGSRSMELVEHRLDNGLRVVLAEDHSAPAVAVNIWYGVGSRHERDGRTGLAHLFEHLMFEGSANVASGEHFEFLEAAGARLNGTTSFDRTNYFETVPTGAFELALWLEADRMGGLLDALTQENLDNQRDVVKNERRQRYDNVPYGTAWERLFAMAFPESHPYHHMPIGSMSDLDSASLEDCRAFFRANYAPGNAVLSIVGDVAAEYALSAVKRYFDGIPAGPVVPPAPDGTIGVLDAEVRQDVHEDVPSESLYYLFRLPADGTDELEAVDLAVRVLGEGSSGRLVRRLVRREQLARMVAFGVNRMIGGASAATLIVRARKGAALADIERVIDEELALFAADGPDAEEVDRARAQAERAWLEDIETFEDRADGFARFATLFGDPRLALTAIDRVNAVTAEQVHAAAVERLTRSNRAVLAYRLDADSSSDGTDSEARA